MATNELDDILNNALNELDEDNNAHTAKSTTQSIVQSQLPTQIRQSAPVTTTSSTSHDQSIHNATDSSNNTQQQSIHEFQSFLAELQSSGLDKEIMSSFGDESKMNEMIQAMSNLSQPNNNNNIQSTSTSAPPSSATTPSYNTNIEQAIKMIADGNKNTTQNNLPDFGSTGDMDEMFSKLMAEMGGVCIKFNISHHTIKSDNILTNCYVINCTVQYQGDGSEGGGMDTMIEKLMQSMLSKDVLYAPMKDIESRYPAWLQANKPPAGKLTRDEYTQYEKQYTILQQICHSFETKPDDMNTIMTLMTQMQEYGQVRA